MRAVAGRRGVCVYVRVCVCVMETFLYKNNESAFVFH